MSLIVEGSRDYYDALVGTAVTPSVTDYLTNNFQQFSQRLSDSAQEWYQRAYQLYDNVLGEQALRQAQIIRNNFDDIWSDSSPVYLTTVDQFQEARLIMQRYMMVEPMAREFFYDDRIEGYDGSYTDPYPTFKTEDHPDYKRVMNGVLQFDEDDDWYCVTYLDELLSDEAPLDITEQQNVLGAWQWLRNHLERKKRDPTSVWDGNVG